jgi:uncharacterized membrane protein YphA (DoxX/SURF4 family)
MSTHQTNLSQTIGRLLYALPFVVFGVLHLLNGGAMTAVVPGWLPGALVWVYLTGAANLAAGVALAANRLVKPTSLALVALLGTYILFVHAPSLLGGGGQMAMQSLLKDVGLAGGALLIFGSHQNG